MTVKAASRSGLVVFRLTAIGVLLSPASVARGVRFSYSAVRASPASSARPTFVQCELFNFSSIGTNLVRPRERSSENCGTSGTLDAELE